MQAEGSCKQSRQVVRATTGECMLILAIQTFAYNDGTDKIISANTEGDIQIRIWTRRPKDDAPVVLPPEDKVSWAKRILHWTMLLTTIAFLYQNLVSAAKQ